MATTEDNVQARYSLNSKRLWEDAPLCPLDKYSIKYEQSTFYLQANATPYRVRPVVSPDTPGFFTAYPGGLAIDQNSGEIDINASDTGIIYSVEFTPYGENCVARTEVLISGISYKGRICSLSKSGPDIYLSKPVYNGAAGKVPTGKFGIIPRKSNKPVTADLKGLVIDQETGIVNLKQTIESGALGFRQKTDGSGNCDIYPQNGTCKEFTIYYRLNDQSNKVLNKTSVRIHFFNSQEEIPYNLQRRMVQQGNSLKRANKLMLQPLVLLLSSALLVAPELPDGLITFLFTLFSFLLFLDIRSSNSPYKPPEHCCTP